MNTQHKSNFGFSEATTQRIKIVGFRRLKVALSAANLALDTFLRSKAATYVDSTSIPVNLAAERLRRLKENVRSAQANLDRFVATEGVQEGELDDATLPFCGL